MEQMVNLLTSGRMRLLKVICALYTVNVANLTPESIIVIASLASFITQEVEICFRDKFCMGVMVCIRFTINGPSSHVTFSDFPCGHSHA